jgi:hypothetical protein
MVAAISPACSRKASAKPATTKLDYAYYNPVSLVLRDKRFLEQDLASDGISIESVHDEFFAPSAAPFVAENV